MKDEVTIFNNVHISNENSQNSLNHDDEMMKEIEIEVDRKMNLYLSTIKYSKLSLIITFFLFLVMISVNISSPNRINYNIVVIPALMSVISLALIYNSYLNIQNLLDSFESDDLNLGTLVSYISLNLSGVSILVFLILISLKIEGIITTSYLKLAIPMYVAFAIALFYFIFMLPALIKTNLYFELLVILFYLVSLFVGFFNLMYFLDISSKIQITYVLLPIALSLVLHIVYICVQLALDQENELSINIIRIIVITGLLMILILVCLKIDLNYSINSFYLIVLVMLIFIFYASFKLFDIFTKKDDE